MARLGYDRYGAVGNDAGSMISPELGRNDPDHVVGVHVTQMFSFPSGDPAEMTDLSAGRARAARNAPVVLREQVQLQHAHVAAAADARLRAQRLAGRAAGVERPAARRGPGSRLRPHQRDDLLADADRHLGGPPVLRERARGAARPSRRPCPSVSPGSGATSTASAGSPSGTTATSSTGRRTTTAATSRRTRLPTCTPPTSASSSARSAAEAVPWGAFGM